MKKALRAMGLELRPYTPQNSTEAQLAALLHSLRIDLVIDVGANEGQYGETLRIAGYAGRLVSFEPLPGPHEKLTAMARRHPPWDVAPRQALGEAAGEVTINVSANSVSSSILEMLPTHVTAAPESAYVGIERVPMARLDDAIGTYLADASRILLKIDTQGYERHVLAGAPALLRRVCAVQLELSLVALYAGEANFEDTIGFMNAEGFGLYALLPSYVESATGRTLQVDGVFWRPQT